MFIEEPKPKKLSYLRFMVIDSGLGIDKDRLKNIFNLFEASDSLPLKDTFKNKKCKWLIE